MSLFRKLFRSQTNNAAHQKNDGSHQEDGPRHEDSQYEENPSHEHEMPTSEITVVIVPWWAKSVEKEMQEVQITSQSRVGLLKRMVYDKLEMSGFGINLDEMQLWALDSPDVTDLSTIKFDGSDGRLTLLSIGRDRIRKWVDATNEDLLFIGRPSILNSNGEIEERTFCRLVQGSAVIFARMKTLELLWEVLRNRKIVHARGTPACGKSTLARTFATYAKCRDPTLKVLLITWNKDTYGGLGTYRERLKKHHERFFSGLHSSTDFTNGRYMLIIDEAQNSYVDQEFWTDYVKTIADTTFLSAGPFVLMFSSWGSPSENPIKHIGSAPARFAPGRRMSVQPSEHFPVGIYFKEADFNSFAVSYAEGLNKDTNGKFTLLFEPEALEVLYAFTSGHPGLSKGMLEIISNDQSLRASLRAAKPITVRVIQELVQSPSLILSLQHCSARIGAAVPSEGELTERSMASGMLRVMRDGYARESSSFQIPAQNESELMSIYKRGYLQADLDEENETVYVIPTRFHFLYYERIYLGKQPQFPIHQFPRPIDLCLAAVKEFSVEALRKGGRGIGIGSRIKPNPFEAQYQDELYRTCHKVLCGGYLTSEWMSASPPGGRIDFIVKDVRWGIELVRESSALSEHLARFKRGGAYWASIVKKEIEEFIVLDFTVRIPTEKWQDNFLYKVVFDERFNAVKVFDYELKLLANSVLLKGC